MFEYVELFSFYLFFSFTEIPLTVSSRLSWTWREGRMRMYYLVARSLVGLHLKALHELDADGYNPMNSEDFCISPTFTGKIPLNWLDKQF